MYFEMNRVLVKSFIFYFLIISLLKAPLAFGQTANFTFENFEKEFLEFVPTQRKDVSAEKFSLASMIIENTKKAVENDAKGFNVSDYWNITTAFFMLKESKEVLGIAFKKMAESEGGCEYLQKFKDRVAFDNALPELYDYYLWICSTQKSSARSGTFNLTQYILKNSLDPDLVKLVYQIQIDDQSTRTKGGSGTAEQFKLDVKNQALIDSLYKEYNSYIGKSLVGEEFAAVMWVVIQHSNIQMMERYLPVLHKAVKDKELPLTPFKMLIDRIHSIKNGYQIFGSQEGVPIASEEVRKKLMNKWGIE